MHIINPATSEPDIIYKMAVHAAGGKFMNGAHPMDGHYFEDCRWFFPSGMTAIFTRDVDLIRLGFWEHLGIEDKETHPSHNQCMHLSLSFQEPGKPFGEGEHLKKNVAETRKWVKATFGRRVDNIWAEPPETPTGIEDDVWHYRLFLQMDCKTPQAMITPVRSVLEKTRLIPWFRLENVNHEVDLLDEQV